MRKRQGNGYSRRQNECEDGCDCEGGDGEYCPEPGETRVAASGLRGVIVTRHAKQNTGKQESKSELASANLQNMVKRRSWKSRKKFVIIFLVVTLAAMAAAKNGRSGRSAPRPAEGE